MSFYDQRDSYGQYNTYLTDSRRSFSEEQSGAKRKKTNWSRKRRGNVNPNRNVTIDTPLFKEPAVPFKRNSLSNSNRRSRSGHRDTNHAYQSRGTQPFFDLRDMPEFVEPEHSGAQWMWKKYFNDCKDWQDKHKLAYYRSRCLALQFENQMLYEQINSLIEEHCVFAAERGEVPTMRLPDINRKQPRQFDQDAQGKTPSPPKKQAKTKMSSGSPDSDLEYELGKEMTEMVKISIQHKLELERERKKESDGNEQPKEPGPHQPMGLKRSEELNELYGNNATLIQGLETSVQLNFNRSCDTFKPEMWPAVPFNGGKAVVG